MEVERKREGEGGRKESKILKGREKESDEKREKERDGKRKELWVRGKRAS